MSTPRSAAHGFTLVEVIVALSLVALIMLGLVSALRTFGDTASALDARSGDSTEARLLADFLRATLARAVAQPRVQTVDDGPVVPFSGSAGELRWLGNLPARHGAGGMHYMRLFAGEGGLWLQYLPHPGNTEPPDWSTAAVHLLSPNLDLLRIAYQTRPQQPGEEAEWLSFWDDLQHLPGRLRIDLVIAGQHRPPLIVALDAAAGRSVGERIVAGEEE
ncbi:PulJ/GspJ family protein [Thauera butanivorans]|uniref:PulJ/GspJ family protein n=1 Tax=Thauera butanivorans TaxID=86174 RepID=UPI003AB1ECEA